jgi:hypothetical protein
LRDGGRVLDGTLDGRCRKNHSADPKIVGEVEWMRFIHAVGSLLSDEANPFLGRTTIDSGVEMYRDEKGKARVRLVFLKGEPPQVLMEVFDRTLEPVFDLAFKKVEESFS